MIALLMATKANNDTGCPKKIWFKPIFEFFTMRRVFSGVKNNSKNFGNKEILSLIGRKLALLMQSLAKVMLLSKIFTGSLFMHI